MGIPVVDQQPAESTSHVIPLTAPRDACRSSLVCHVFKSAADSVGEISAVRLQRDHFQAMHWRRLAIGARGLCLAWEGTPNHWKWTSLPKSR